MAAAVDYNYLNPEGDEDDDVLNIEGAKRPLGWVEGENEGGEGGEGDAVLPAEKKLKKRVVRRVTVEQLTSEAGLPLLYKTLCFPKEGAKSFKTTGDEQKDLAALLNAYQGWARSMLPTLPFATFVEQTEKLSGNKVLTGVRLRLENSGFLRHDVEDAKFVEGDDGLDNPLDEFRPSEHSVSWEDMQAEDERVVAKAPAPAAAAALSAEQMARITENRAKAMEKRKAREAAEQQEQQQAAAQAQAEDELMAQMDEMSEFM